MPDETPTVDPQEPTLFGFPLNRIVAFAGPHIAWLSGVVATWLTVHLHLFATFHVGTSGVAKAIASVLVFGVVTLVTWLGHQKWLEGFQAWAYAKGVGTVVGNPFGEASFESDLSGPLVHPPFDEGGPAALELDERDLAEAFDPATVSDSVEEKSPPPPVQR